MVFFLQHIKLMFSVIHLVKTPGRCRLLEDPQIFPNDITLDGIGEGSIVNLLLSLLTFWQWPYGGRIHIPLQFSLFKCVRQRFLQYSKLIITTVSFKNIFSSLKVTLYSLAITSQSYSPAPGNDYCTFCLYSIGCSGHCYERNLKKCSLVTFFLV